MATARELEDMGVQIRTRREHGKIPNAEWQRLTEAAESAFEGKSRDHRPDAEQRAAMDLARDMGTAEIDRPNPFNSPALRESYESADRAGQAIERTGRGNAEGRAERGGETRADARDNPLGVSAPEWNRAVQNAELTIEARQIANPGAADPVMQMGMKIPAGRQAQARGVAEQLAHSEDIHAGNIRGERAEPGRTYEGRVIGTTENQVFQNVGGRVIEHDRQALTGRGMSGELTGREVKIDYPHGRVGLVKEASQAREIGEQQKALQKDYGGREK